MSDQSNVILCIDDEKIILASLRSQLLRNLGTKYQYEFAESAEEGKMIVEGLKEEGRQLHSVVCDWLMPGMKGDEFLYWISEFTPDANKILLTGHVDNEVVKTLECCNGAGITCIYKPWDEERLLKLISN